MKNILSFLSVAALAVVFGVGCAKLEKCVDSKDEAQCQDPTNFKDELVCKYDSTKEEGKRCENLDVSAGKARDAQATCMAITKDKDACEKAGTKLNETEAFSCYWKKDAKDSAKGTCVAVVKKVTPKA
jgi:hypothetical protein